MICSSGSEGSEQETPSTEAEESDSDNDNHDADGAPCGDNTGATSSEPVPPTEAAWHEAKELKSATLDHQEGRLCENGERCRDSHFQEFLFPQAGWV